MIHQINLEGKDKVEVAIERIKDFATLFKSEADRGYYLAFSGGKDSVVCKKLLDLAGVKYDAHYRITSVDPPELVRFIKTEYPDVKMEHAYWEKDGRFHKAGDPITMWNLIPEKLMPPTQIVRYCCEALKESGGDGRLTVTGVRWAESSNRKANQGLVTIIGNKKENQEMIESGNFQQTRKSGVILVNDNDEARDTIEQCYRRRKTILNPIIDWEDEEVWEFIREYKVPYCNLYDNGFKRLGCIGCPMGTAQKREFELYPKYKKAYVRAFERMIQIRKERRLEVAWETGEDVMEWWINKEQKK